MVTLLLVVVVKPISQIDALLFNHFQPIQLSAIFFDLLLVESNHDLLLTLTVLCGCPLSSQLGPESALLSPCIVLRQLLLHDGFGPEIDELLLRCIGILRLVVDDIAHAHFEFFFARDGSVGFGWDFGFGRDRCELKVILPPPLIDYRAREGFVEGFLRGIGRARRVVIVVVIVEMSDRVGTLTLHLSYLLISNFSIELA